ncbi:MAG: class I SAM-dependent methyltransferase [Lentisphaerae bacterium]|nr:class I SAM-dependent methyltransferase [Lentisphaerota bacterium]MCP4102181.1 class I SAM-dependent methyltransferase [Lentisphaerota bacterium]
MQVVSKKFDYKSVVVAGYNKCGVEYDLHKEGGLECSIDYLFNTLPDKAKVLDVGCGAGRPVASLLSKKFDVLGIDISPEQIKLAQKNCPQAEFQVLDMVEADFPLESFDAIVSFYALFHINRELHYTVLQKFYNWLENKGKIIISVVDGDKPGYTEDDFFDTKMYWSHYSLPKYYEMLEKIGFKLVQAEALGHGYNRDDMEEESHQLIIAEK